MGDEVEIVAFKKELCCEIERHKIKRKIEKRKTRSATKENICLCKVDEIKKQNSFVSEIKNRRALISNIISMADNEHGGASQINREEIQFKTDSSSLYEYRKIIYEYNQTDRDYPGDKTIQQLFEEQVTRTPNRVAVVFGEQELTYQELNTRANRLACYIRERYKKQTKKELEPDTLIALCLDRSIEVIVAMLAILKAGGAYVPIDSSYPSERINYILNDTRARLLITQTHLIQQLQASLEQCQLVQFIIIDDDQTQQDLKLFPATRLKSVAQSANIAYVIYTSGTTGKPKGVMIEHRSVANLAINQLELHELDSDVPKNCLHFAPIVFDGSVYEIFHVLFFGHKLYIVSDEQRNDINKLNELLNQAKIEVAVLPPALLRNIDIDSSYLKTLILAGESSTKTVLDRYYARGVKVINAYGPTEATVCSSSNIYTQNGSTNIGKALLNTKLYVLDSNLMPVAHGVTGELFIGGAGLARGYLNQLELTSERFITNPFATEKDKAKGYTRLYKTGDLVRWLPNGNLEYIGRNDFQVKLRGFRIELGEIESAIAKLNGIKQVIVQVREKQSENGLNKYLVAYYVLEAKNKLVQENIVKYLERLLPEYMVPSAYVELESFPLTINGKIDRKALPDPGFIDPENYIAPSNELEKQLCQVWQEVLGIERVGVAEDFFRIGGDSILSILLSSKLRKAGLTCTVKNIFEQRTIRELSKLLQTQNFNIEMRTEQGLLEGEFDLLPIQEWFFEKVKNQELKQPNHWNQSFVAKVPELEIDKLKNIIPILAKHHDVLRVKYKQNKKGEYTQFYHAAIKLPELKILNVSDMKEFDKKIAIEKKLAEWQEHFDIEAGPLWQMGYIYGYDDKTARIYFALHHLIVDAVSWRILLEDIKVLYNREELQDKGTSYRQWVEVVKIYEQNHAKEKQYWLEIQKDQQDYSVYAQATRCITEIEFSKELTKDLLSQANEAYHTEINDLLLAALNYALMSWNGNKVNHISLEGHGREHIQEDLDLSRTIGWFTTIYPVRLELKDDLDKSIKYIKESLRAVPNKGLGYSALKYKERKANQIDSLKDLPLIVFNYLGQFDNQAGLWQVVDSEESVAKINQDKNIFIINGIVTEEKLKFTIASMLDSKQTKIFANKFKQQLEEIINHCLARIKSKQIEYTPSDFALEISQDLLDKLQQQARESNNPIQFICSANSLQQGLIYHALSQQHDDAYRVQLLLDYNHQINLEYYKQAWKLAIENYPALKVSFNWEEELIQIIHSKGSLNFTYHDLVQKQLTEAQRNHKIQQLQKDDRRQGFDLTQPTQLRLQLIKFSHEHYTLLQSVHHSIADGWSGPILLNKVHEFYQQLLAGITPKVQEDTSYVRTQKYYREHKQSVKEYWIEQIQTVEQINDINPLLSKIADLDNVKSITQASEDSIQIQGKLYKDLKKLTKQQGITLSTIVQFAWHKLLQTYTRDEQTIVGTTVSGRNIPIDGIEDSVGLYINTLPLIIDWSNQHSKTIGEQLKDIHQQITDINDYSQANLAELQHQGQRLFHSLVVCENHPVPQNTPGHNEQPVINSRVIKVIEKLDYLLSLIIYEQDQCLNLNIKYAGEYVTADRVLVLLNQLQLILSQTLEADRKVSDISLLGQSEYQKIVYKYNATDQDYPQDKTIYQLFEEQVLKSPNKVALLFEEQELTYKELNTRANQLARYIQAEYKQQTQQDLASDTLIALCLERSLEMIVAIFAVLKAGCAYVPIDPSYPEDRINYILEDTKASFVITQSSLQEKLELITKQTQLIVINDSDIRQKIEQFSAEDLGQTSHSKNLAYIIYTSGTTGKPKGVMVEHAAVAQFCINNNYCSINADCIFGGLSNYAFDGSIFDIFSSMLNGSKLVLFPQQAIMDLSKFERIVKKQRVNTVFITTALFDEFSKKTFGENPLLNIKNVLFGGQKANSSNVELFLAEKRDGKLVHVYGPTETIVYASRYELSKVNNGACPIGSALCNKRLYVLDANLLPVPHGVIGELYIGGAGMARGYLNQEKLTQEKFIDNPFATEADEAKGYTKLYKTGDLVRWLPNGNIEYIGRNDFQIKLRGFRIELGEIESALTKINGINQVTVQAREKEIAGGTDKYLVAYYVLEPGINLTKESIVEQLEKHLPEYMVPAAYVELEKFPLTANGKLDRKALPNPEFIDQESYVAPTNEVEQQLCRIWQEVLRLDRVGITDDFFRIGGNSILAIQLIHKISKHINQLSVMVSDIFQYRTIKLILGKCGFDTELLDAGEI